MFQTTNQGMSLAMMLAYGNQTRQWKIPYQWRFLARKFTDKWSIFRQTMFDYRRVDMRVDMIVDNNTHVQMTKNEHE